MASRAGDWTRGASSAAPADGSWPATSTPDVPSWTAVRSPPTAAATTGVPQACASRATRPKDSLWLRTTGTSAAREGSARRPRGRGGGVVRAQPLGRLRRQEADDVGEAEPRGELLQLPRRLEARAAGGADDVHP